MGAKEITFCFSPRWSNVHQINPQIQEESRRVQKKQHHHSQSDRMTAIFNCAIIYATSLSNQSSSPPRKCKKSSIDWGGQRGAPSLSTSPRWKGNNVTYYSARKHKIQNWIMQPSKGCQLGTVRG